MKKQLRLKKQYTYDPYGKLCGSEGSFDFTGMYAGKEIDSETGLTYHWNRWRNEEGDAFISEDPAKDGYNWYAYANCNPFKFVDVDGLQAKVLGDKDGTSIHDDQRKNLVENRRNNRKNNDKNTKTPTTSELTANDFSLKKAENEANAVKKQNFDEKIKDVLEIDFIESSKNLYQSDTGIFSDNPYVITGKNLGEEIPNFNNFDINILIEVVTDNNLMGKKYFQDLKQPYVCTTFVEDVLNLMKVDLDKYLPGRQRVVESISKLKEKKDSMFITSNQNIPGEGTYLFYFDYGDKTGHTGFVSFDKEGKATILHNGASQKRTKCVNVWKRNSTNNFENWFKDSGTLYYKKFEVN